MWYRVPFGCRIRKVGNYNRAYPVRQGQVAGYAQYRWVWMNVRSALRISR